MESHSTLRSLTDSWFAAHISSILAAIAPKWGAAPPAQSALILQFAFMLTAYCLAHGMLDVLNRRHMLQLHWPLTACLRGHSQTEDDFGLFCLFEHLSPDRDDITLKATLILAGFQDDVFHVSRDV